MRTLLVTSSTLALSRRMRVLSSGPGTCRIGVDGHALKGLARSVAAIRPGIRMIASSTERASALEKAVRTIDPTGEKYGTAGAKEALLETFGLMRLSEIARGALEDGAKAERADVVRAGYRAYLEGLDKKLDEAGMLANLLSVLEDPAPLPCMLKEIRTLIICGFLLAEPWERRILTALKERLEREGAEIQETRDDSPSSLIPEDLRQTLRGGTGGLAASRPVGIEFHEYADPSNEIRAVARRIRALLAGEARADNPEGPKANPGEVLILAPEESFYRRTLATELDTHEIPHDISVASSLVDTPLGAFVLSLLNFDVSRPKSDAIAKLLGSPYVSTVKLWDGAEPISARKASQLIRRFQIRGGTWEDWRTGLEHLAAGLESEANLKVEAMDNAVEEDFGDGDEEETGESTGGAKRYTSSDASGLRALSGMLEKLPALLAPASGDDTLRNRAAWLRRLLGEDGLNIGARLDANRSKRFSWRDRAAHERIIEILDALAEYGEEPTTKEGFRETVEDAFSAEGIRHAANWTETVSVRSPANVEPEKWAYVFAVGMIDGLMPATASDGGILWDEDLRALGLDPSPERNRKAMETVLAALETAGRHLVVSWSNLSSDGRKALPSILLERIDDALAEWTRDRGQNRRESRFVHWLTRHGPAEILPGGCKRNELPSGDGVTPAEALVRNRLTGNPASSPDDFPETCEYRKLRALWDADSWVPCESNEHDSRWEFGGIDTASGLSPSRLDEFGKCPYRYFAQTVLRVSKLRDPAIGPDAASLGTTIHKAFADAVNSTIKTHGSEHFLCDSENTYKLRVAEFQQRILGPAFENAFEMLTKTEIGPSRDVVAGLLERWKRTCTEYVKQLFVVDLGKIASAKLEPARHVLQSKITKGKEKNSKAAFEAESILLGIEEMKENAETVAEPKWPYKYGGEGKEWFSCWRKVHCGSDLQPWLPVLCEWEFGKKEEPLEVDVGEGEKIFLRGIMDRLDFAGDRVRVADYKTGKDVDKLATNVGNGINMQLAAYVHALDAAQKQDKTKPDGNALPKGMVTEATLIILKKKTKKEGKERAVAFDPEQMEKTRENLRIAHEHIRTGRLAPKPRSSCPFLDRRKYCDYLALCRVENIPDVWLKDGYPELGKDTTPTEEDSE